MNSEKKIIQLLAKKIGSEASDDELNELLGLLQKHLQYSLFIQILQSIEAGKSDIEDELSGESWQMLMQELDKAP